MFTIKHIDEMGAEHLWSATDPSFANGVFTSHKNGETSWVCGGTVYVMNDKGSTVATYRLAPSPEAQNLVGAFGTDHPLSNQQTANPSWREKEFIAAQNEAMAYALRDKNKN